VLAGSVLGLGAAITVLFVPGLLLGHHPREVRTIPVAMATTPATMAATVIAAKR